MLVLTFFIPPDPVIAYTDGYWKWQLKRKNDFYVITFTRNLLSSSLVNSREIIRGTVTFSIIKFALIYLHSAGWITGFLLVFLALPRNFSRCSKLYNGTSCDKNTTNEFLKHQLLIPHPFNAINPKAWSVDISAKFEQHS